MASLSRLLAPQSPTPPSHSTPNSTSPPPRLPYAPTKRVSPPDSVLLPISRTELVQIQSSINPLRTRPIPAESYAGLIAGSSSSTGLPTRPEANGHGNGHGGLKRSRDSGEEPNKRQRGDVVAVASHYNARPNVDVSARQDSPIIGLKKFNNWTKSVLISKFAHAAVPPGAPPGPGGRRPGIKVLDIGCGKGGDLPKWAKANTDEYIGIDLAEVSVEQARDRWNSMNPRNKFRAEFYAMDCYERSIGDVIAPNSRPADVVSMQFCMHYAFESEAKTRQMLENVTQFLRPGGVFIGTIPDSNNLLTRLEELPPDAPSLEFGNEVYRIKFDERDWSEQFGNRYTFYLQDAVEEVPEYVVYWEAFVDLAAEYGLELAFHADFQEIFQREQDVPQYAELLRRMKVVDQNGETDMTGDQWEAATLYIGFAFTKK